MDNRPGRSENNTCTGRNCNVHPFWLSFCITAGLNAEAARQFLHPSLSQLSSPHRLKDMDIAAERIARAIFKQQSIMIFGDYDVDGITPAVLVYEFLKALKAKVSYHIPHRVEEGYGLKSDHILNWAGGTPPDLIITVDCGSASHEAVQTARSLGIDVIITDHHDPDVRLPDAFAVINPKRRDDSSNLEHLAGVGWPLSLSSGLSAHLSSRVKFLTNLSNPT